MAGILVQRGQQSVVARESFVGIERVLGELGTHAYIGGEQARSSKGLHTVGKITSIHECGKVIGEDRRVARYTESWAGSCWQHVLKPGLWDWVGRITPCP